MKVFYKLRDILFKMLLVMSATVVQAEQSEIPEVSDADFMVLAQDAALKNKRLMIIYYRHRCEVCEQLHDNEAWAVQEMIDHYAIYKTNTAVGFDVMCPNGETFSELDFMAIKGIQELPAVMITDRLGNVVGVKNEVLSARQLLAFTKEYKTQRVVGRMNDSY